MPKEPNDQITQDEQLASKLYANTNAKTPTISSSRSGAFDGREAELRDVVGLDANARKGVRTELFGMVEDLPDALARTIVDGAISNIVGQARVVDDEEAAEIEIDKRTAAHNTEVRKELADRYGAEQGESLLKRANKFVTARPTLAKRLRERGLGSRPDIVLALVEHVHLTGFR